MHNKSNRDDNQVVGITTGYSLLENYNNSVEKVLTLMTLYLKIVLNTDVFQHAILGSYWKFWRV